MYRPFAVTHCATLSEIGDDHDRYAPVLRQSSHHQVEKCAGDLSGVISVYLLQSKRACQPRVAAYRIAHLSKLSSLLSENRVDHRLPEHSMEGEIQQQVIVSAKPRSAAELYTHNMYLLYIMLRLVYRGNGALEWEALSGMNS